MLRLVVLMLSVLVAFTRIASADKYDSLGSYVGSMTRSEFNAANDRAAWKVSNPKQEAAELEEYRASERERKQRYADEDSANDAWRAKNPCSFKVGDTLKYDNNLWPGVVWTVQKVKPHPAGGWLLDVIDPQGLERSFKSTDCIALMPGSTWKPKKPLPFGDEESAEGIERQQAEEVAKWKAAYEREQSRIEKKNKKKGKKNEVQPIR